MIVLFLVLFQINLVFVNARYNNSPNNHDSDIITGGEGWVTYDFPRNNRIEIRTNNDIDLDIEINQNLSNLRIRLNITSSESISLSINNDEFGNEFQSGRFNKPKFRYQNRWGVVVHLELNKKVENIQIGSISGEEYNVNSNNVWAYTEEAESDDWTVLETKKEDNYLYSNVSGESVDYYLSMFIPEPENENPFNIYIVITIIIVSALGLIFIFTKSEYLEFIRNRIVPNDTGAHRLTIEEVLENENRTKIIDLILENPGIHFNQLLRLTELSPGNLVWHLDILETYDIIGKKNIGQYLVYFPYYNQNPLTKVDIKLAKSKVTLEVLDIIEKNPGSYTNSIAKILDIDHKTAKYHIDKLLDEGLIETKKSGRKKLLYPIIGKLKELNLDRDSILNGDPERNP